MNTKETLILKTQKELQEIKEKIAEKRKWTFEMACLDDYLDDIEKLPKDLLKLLKSNFPTYMDEEKAETFSSWTEEKKKQDSAEYRQLREIRNFARLALLSYAYDKLDDVMYNIHPEDWETRYGRNFVYSLQDMIRKYVGIREGQNRRKWYDKGYEAGLKGGKGEE